MKVRKLFEENHHGGIFIHDNDVENGKLITDYSNDVVYGSFSCMDKKLTTLEHFPNRVTGNLRCVNNELDSLVGIPDVIEGNCMIWNNPQITSLSGIGKDYLFVLKGVLHFDNSIKSNILGILKIRFLKKVESEKTMGDLLKAVKIINKHLLNKNLRKCKSELEEAGLQEYAKL